ncbi:conserved hypothetical protein [Thermosipho africanus TCF52B]|uniref:Uncharacterized protein n=1 Tax=Thermosipho africanus (strain TCF52B) TaxID=484019 RepID=B7ICM0_THEAB|nr:DUF5320 family protein [Thermosipho africanus]ACJ75747.1 conserved hypothetical protein [Thermosipho africanus TCF52B]
MPGFDGTGPMGTGPVGRRLGPCSNINAPYTPRYGWFKPVVGWFYGYGRGFGRGYGRFAGYDRGRFGRGAGRGFGRFYW